MQTYNAIVRLNAELTNEVPKQNLTAPEVLILRDIHGDDAVVNIVAAEDWDDVFVAIEDANGDTRIVAKKSVSADYEGPEDEYSDEIERERLGRIYGDAILKDDDKGDPREAIARMFGKYAPLPTELPEFKKARKEAAKARGKKGNLDKVA